jgi:hypothetical protein
MEDDTTMNDTPMLAEAAIDPVLIRQEYIKLPADLAIANARFAAAYAEYLHADTACERVKARLSIEWRETLNDMGMKATVGMVDEKVITDDRYIRVQDHRDIAEIDKVKARGVVDALIAKKDMLVSLGAHIRAELSDPTVRAQVRDAYQAEAND